MIINMIDLMLKLDPTFTQQDKKECLPIIEKMFNLSRMARSQGLLYLETILQKEESHFLKAALPFVLEGYSRAYVGRVMQNMILSGGYTGMPLLSRLIMAQGLLDIAGNHTPKQIREMMLSMLGEDFLQHAHDNSAESISEMKNFLSGLSRFIDTREISPEEDTALNGFWAIDDAISELNDRDVQMVLHDLSDKVILGAIYYGSHDLSCCMLKNVPINRRQRLVSEFVEGEYLIRSPKVDIAENTTTELLNRLTFLARTGDIYLDADSEVWKISPIESK